MRPLLLVSLIEEPWMLWISSLVIKPQASSFAEGDSFPWSVTVGGFLHPVAANTTTALKQTKSVVLNPGLPFQLSFTSLQIVNFHQPDSARITLTPHDRSVLSSREG